MKFALHKKIIWAALLLVSLFQTPAHAQSLTQMDAPEFNRYIATHEGLVVLLPVASWCVFCRKLEPDYEKAAVDLKDTGITVIRMDFDRNRDFMESLGIQSLPQTEVYYNGVRRWEYAAGMPELRLVFEARQALEAAQNGSFVIKRYSVLTPVQP